MIKKNNNNGRTSFRPYIREAQHSGSWYSSNESILDSELSSYLANAIQTEEEEQQKEEEQPNNASSGAAAAAATTVTADDESNNERNTTKTSKNTKKGRPRAIISPHAGYSYSGPTAAFAYTALMECFEQTDDEKIDTILVLHPSHRIRLDGCAISGASYLQTPLGNLIVDDDLRSELLSTGEFTLMKSQVDEDEHSGEMQYPFIAKILRQKPHPTTTSNLLHSVKVLPIMAGAMTPSMEKHFGHLLAPIVSRPNIFTIISSDFCHWGQRFQFYPTGHNDILYQQNKNKNKNNNKNTKTSYIIADYIEYLDTLGMNHIALQRPEALTEYFKRYSNTICGRHPIAIWINAVVNNYDNGIENLDINFVRYDQSNRVQSIKESSVSYASAVARLNHFDHDDEDEDDMKKEKTKEEEEKSQTISACVPCHH